MSKRVQTDAEVTARCRSNPTIARLIDELAYEIRHGDAADRKRAEESLRNQGLLIREVASIKRHLKS